MEGLNKAFKSSLFLGLIFLLTISANSVFAQKNDEKNTSIGAQNFKPIDTTRIERVIGIKGKANNGEYKITIPQNDLTVMVMALK